MTTDPTTALARLLRGAPPSSVTDWRATIALADTHALLPAVWSAAAAHGWWTALPADVLAAISIRFAPGTQAPLPLLQRAYEANIARTIDLHVQAVRTLRNLEQNAIAAVALKGAHALLAELVARPGRPGYARSGHSGPGPSGRVRSAGATGRRIP